MVRVENIVTNKSLEFDDHTCPEYALLYANCVEDDNLASWFFNKLHDKKLDDVKKKFRLFHGKLTISCGDWYFRKTSGVYPGQILE